METWMWAIWLSVFVVSLIIEAIGTDLVSVWFSFGSVVALIISFIPGVEWWIELIVFIVISIVTLICLRPLVNKFLKKDVLNSNIDDIAHKKGILTKKITPLHSGECKVNDVIWTAISTNDNEVIQEGSVVEVLSVTGNKLVVKKVADEATSEEK